jgi:hypothetical protein
MAMPISRRKEHRHEQAENARVQMAGTGRYVFKNKSGGELFLPKPTLAGRKSVVKDGEFEGDSYFFKMIPRELLFVKEVEHIMQSKEEVLLTEQPPVVTTEGQVEFVRQTETEPLNEGSDKKKAKPKLLTEPSDGKMRIIR